MIDVFSELFDFFDLFGESSRNKYVPLDSSTGDYMFFNDEENYGIFVESDFKTEYRESCSGILFESQVLNINNVVKRGYVLTCTVEDALSEFVRVCESLIQEDRNELSLKPSGWFDKWKETFGNANITRNTYPVIGELYILYELRRHGYPQAMWTGPNAGVCDITDPESGMYFEVKSTITRNSSIVTISEEFQLKKADYLCFCRFEEDVNGEYSIESMITNLERTGYDRKSLEASIKKLGIRNTSLRTLRYDLLESAYYPVSGNIPDIMEFFINGQKPASIQKISYSVNLSGLKFQTTVPVKPNTRNE